MLKQRQDLLVYLWLTSLAVALAGGIYHCFFRIGYVNLYFHNLVIASGSCHGVLFSLGEALILFIPFLRIAIVRGTEQAKSYATALTPLLLLLPGFWITPHFYSTVVFIVITGLVVFRLGLVAGWQLNDPGNRIGRILPPTLVWLGFAAFSLYGLYLQHLAWRNLYLFWPDWGILFEMIKHAKTWRFGYSDFYEFNHLGMHFSPSLILLYPLMWFKNVHAFFLTSSMFLYGSGVVAYYFARAVGLSRCQACVMAYICFFTPGLTNLNLAIFYSFHENHMAPVLILATAYFWIRKKFVLAALMFALSLGVKEDVAVFFAGLGGILLLQKKYREGFSLLSIGLTVFFVLYYVFFPWMRNGNAYYFVSNYSGLGNSLTEIALSPLRNPQVFWPRLVRYNIIGYVVTLFTPFALLLGVNPLIACTSGIIIIFTCLQTAETYINIMCWYQIMPLIAIYLCMISNGHKIAIKTPDSRYWQFLRSGIAKRSPKVSISAIMIGTLTSVVVSWFLWGQSHWGKVFLPGFRQDARADMVRLSQLIPESERVTTTMRPAGHLFFRGLNFKTEKKFWTNYVILDLRDKVAMEQMKSVHLRDELLLNKKYFPVAVANLPYSLIMLFSCDPKAKSMIPPRHVENGDERWKNADFLLPCNNSDCEVKGKLGQVDGRVTVELLVRLKKVVNYDALFTIGLSDGRQTRYWTFFAGDGLLPLWQWQKDQVFSYLAVLPPNFGKPIHANCQLTKFPGLMKSAAMINRP